MNPIVILILLIFIGCVGIIATKLILALLEIILEWTEEERKKRSQQ